MQTSREAMGQTVPSNINPKEIVVGIAKILLTLPLAHIPFDLPNLLGVGTPTRTSAASREKIPPKAFNIGNPIADNEYVPGLETRTPGENWVVSVHVDTGATGIFISIPTIGVVVPDSKDLTKEQAVEKYLSQKK